MSAPSTGDAPRQMCIRDRVGARRASVGHRDQRDAELLLELLDAGELTVVDRRGVDGMAVERQPRHPELLLQSAELRQCLVAELGRETAQHCSSLPSSRLAPRVTRTHRRAPPTRWVRESGEGHEPMSLRAVAAPCNFCLLYTSDAADDLLCVDLGGRRII